VSNFLLKTPVAFIIFNRPDKTELVFAEIAKAKPSKLLVIGDGPRLDRIGDLEKVSKTRDIIKRVDWPCEVLVNYSDSNLGCKARVSSGIDWVFECVSEAIILEDDCLPHPSFFRFCEEMLNRYRDDRRIGMISGDNFHFGHVMDDKSYYFSNFNNIWGWATWRDRWQHDYDVDLKNWPDVLRSSDIEGWFGFKGAARYYANIFERVYNNRIDTWDYQWLFGSRLNGRASIVPNVNLISNIGFGLNATHTISNSVLANMATEEILFPLKHPDEIYISTKLDEDLFRKFIDNSISKRIKRYILAIMNRG
jgi:hypothetical protein